MMPFSEYSKVFNKCCLFYIGKSPIVLDQIISNKKDLEKLYPNLQISICCIDELFKENENLIKKSDLIMCKNDFGYIREVSGPIN